MIVLARSAVAVDLIILSALRADLRDISDTNKFEERVEGIHDAEIWSSARRRDLELEFRAFDQVRGYFALRREVNADIFLTGVMLSLCLRQKTARCT